MIFDFSEKKKVKIDMINYMGAMVDDLSVNFKTTNATPTPAAEDLFAAGDNEDLDMRGAEEFQTLVAKGLFACKCAHPDIHPMIAVLCTHVKKPNRLEET
jgi:hypothetical protein